MRLPFMENTPRKTTRQIVTFGGVNYSREASDGELSHSENMSAAQFPCLSQRAGRKTAGTYRHPTGIYARGGMAVIDGTDFIWNGRVVGQVSTAEKHWAAINTKIVIFPDKVYFDTATETFGNLGASLRIPPECMSFAPRDSLTISDHIYMVEPEERHEDVEIVETVPGEGEPPFTVTVWSGVSVNRGTGEITFEGEAQKEPGDLAQGDILPDREDRYLAVQYVHQLETGEEEGRRWSVYCVPYVVTGRGQETLSSLFRDGDAVEISGCITFPERNGTHIIRSVDQFMLKFDRDAFDDKFGYEGGEVTIARKIPDLTVVCESDNRIWGAEGTTIYASALGDPTNFFIYDGLSTDSYAVATGTDGEFTGCVAYSSTVLFFKENYLHKVLGSYPAQYEIFTYKVSGVQKGCEKSLAVISETVFYKGKDGVYAYSGGVPELISENFGTRRFTGGVAGTDGRTYYISMRGDQGWEMYTYLPDRGIWLREDATHAEDFACLDGTLYYLDADTGKLVMAGQDMDEEGRIRWSAATVPFTETIHGRKGYSRLSLRAELEAGAWFKVEVSADGAPFKQVFLSHDQSAKTVQVPILPTRCDQFTVRLSGRGRCAVKSLVREFSTGSEY